MNKINECEAGTERRLRIRFHGSAWKGVPAEQGAVCGHDISGAEYNDRRVRKGALEWEITCIAVQDRLRVRRARSLSAQTAQAARSSFVR